MGALAGIALPPEVLLLGALTGLGYGLLAAGLVLTFRLSRVLNLAHAQIGAFGAVVLEELVRGAGWSYWPALAVGRGVARGRRQPRRRARSRRPRPPADLQRRGAGGCAGGTPRGARPAAERLPDRRGVRARPAAARARRRCGGRLREHARRTA